MHLLCIAQRKKSEKLLCSDSDVRDSKWPGTNLQQHLKGKFLGDINITTLYQIIREVVHEGHYHYQHYPQ